MGGHLDTSFRKINLFPKPHLGTCVKDSLDSARIYVHLKMGMTTYEFGDERFNFHIALTISARDALSQVISTYQDTLHIQSNAAYQIDPEQMKTHNVKNEVLADATSFTIDNITFIPMTNMTMEMMDSVVLVLFYRDHHFINAVREYNPSLPIDTVIFPSGKYLSGMGAVDYLWNIDYNCHKDTLPNHQIQILRLYNIDPLNTDTKIIKTKIEWSKALSIETGNSKTTIRLTTPEGEGYYIWRVRPIGNYYPGGIANDRNWGVWSTCKYNGQNLNKDTILDITSETGFVGGFYSEKSFDLDINWIYKRMFTEGSEGTRVSEAVTYADELFNVRQEQKYLPSQKVRISNQNIYDYSCRQSLKTLPVPVIVNNGDLNQVKYMRKMVQTKVGDSLFTAKHFDEPYNYRSPQGVKDAYPNPLYYYTKSYDFYLPSAEGYPLHQNSLLSGWY